MSNMSEFLFTMDEVLRWKEPEWLIEGFVHQGSSVFLSGPPKTGKSLFGLRLAAAVSSGASICGRKAKKGKVIYLAAERSRLMMPRAQALLERGIPFEMQNLRVYTKPLSFLNDEEVRKFADTVGDTDLLIVDTLRRCFHGGRENDNNDMTMWASGVELFCKLTGASYVVIHHNHREYRDSRGRPMATDYAGGGSLLGSFDGQFALRPLDNGIVEVKVTGANEGNDFCGFLKSEPVLVGNHTTWVMVDVEMETSSVKPDLEALIKNELIQNPESTIAALYEHCQQNTTIQEHWPKLSKETVRTVVNKWIQAGSITTIPNPSHTQQRLHTWSE